MSLEGERRQKTGQLELAWGDKGEAPKDLCSGEAPTAAKGNERSGSDLGRAKARELTSTFRTAVIRNKTVRPVVWEGSGGVKPAAPIPIRAPPWGREASAHSSVVPALQLPASIVGSRETRTWLGA